MVHGPLRMLTLIHCTDWIIKITTLHDPMDCSTPDFPVLHLPELAQIHVHWVSDAIQPTHPLSSPSLPAFNISQHRVFFLMSQLFASGGQSPGASASASVLPMNIQDQFPLGLTGLNSLQPKGLLRVFSKTTVQKHQFFYGPTLTFTYAFWKNHSFD